MFFWAIFSLWLIASFLIVFLIVLDVFAFFFFEKIPVSIKNISIKCKNYSKEKNHYDLFYFLDVSYEYVLNEKKIKSDKLSYIGFFISKDKISLEKLSENIEFVYIFPFFKTSVLLPLKWNKFFTISFAMIVLVPTILMFISAKYIYQL